MSPIESFNDAIYLKMRKNQGPNAAKKCGIFTGQNRRFEHERVVRKKFHQIYLSANEIIYKLVR